MKKYSMPADFNTKTIDAYCRLNEIYKDSQIHETYGQITIGNIFESGRIYKDIPQVDICDLRDYIQYSKIKGIDFNYTINGTCMNNREFTRKGVEEIKKFLYLLDDAGVDSLTVALPSLVEIVKSVDCNFKLKASTLCQITNANKALSFKKAGFNRIVLEESINRDFFNLKEIVSVFGEGVEVIINTLCYKDCIYRMFHYNQMGHDSLKKTDQSISSYYNHQCMLKRCETTSSLLKLSWIRPEDISYYSNIGINYFKIQGRNTVLKGNPIKVAESYMKESFEGNIIDLLELFNPINTFRINLDNKKLDGYIKPFYEKRDFCKRNCLACGYCDSFIKKCTNYEEAEKINSIARKFYSECDEYLNMVESVHYNGEDDSNENETIDNGIDIEFNLD